MIRKMANGTELLVFDNPALQAIALSQFRNECLQRLATVAGDAAEIAEHPDLKAATEAEVFRRYFRSMARAGLRKYTTTPRRSANETQTLAEYERTVELFRVAERSVLRRLGMRP
jgi:hypothetical protein